MSVELTTKDYEFLHKQSTQLLTQIEQAELGSYKTKFELIAQYVEVERKLLEAGKLELHDKKDFASYIYRKLSDRQVTLSRNPEGFYVLFREDEKRNNKLHLESEENSSAFTKRDNPVESPRKVFKQEIDDEYTQVLEYATVIIQQAQDLCNDIIVKYKGVTVLKDGVETEVNFRDEVKKGIGSAKEFETELREINAKLEDCAKHLDLRNKALEFKKIKALLLEKCEYNIARVARLIHVSPKHLAANVLRNESQKLLSDLEWFDTIDLELSGDYKKGDTISIKIDDWYNRQIERLNLNLPFMKPKIEYIAKS